MTNEDALDDYSESNSLKNVLTHFRDLLVLLPYDKKIDYVRKNHIFFDLNIMDIKINKFN